ncbi:MAG TPA: site-2 protease family protein [Dongiaceae bacterium]|nr:site-2 protease family protein [Dongiaceae bacterium]
MPPSEATARLEPLPRPKRLWLAVLLFLATFATCVAMGRQFALAFERGEAADLGEISVSLKLLYKDPTALAPGVSFALALLGILLVHELGHYFACRYHKIRASYPYFIPFPSLIGTLGAFILMRSPIRSRRALFDVGASGPLAGFCVAVPVLIWGVAHSRVVPGLASENAQVVFGAPLALRLLARWFFPGANPLTLLLHPVGRAAWVGLFATALNLLPMGQLDGGHVLRSVNARLHRWAGWLVPAALVLLGYFEWPVWWMWAAILLGLRFLRIPPVQDQRPLDSTRLVLAIITLLVMLLCFMPAPIS